MRTRSKERSYGIEPDRRFWLIVIGIVMTMIGLGQTALAAQLTVTVARPTSVGNLPIQGAHACYINASGTAFADTNDQGRAVFNNVQAGTGTLTVNSVLYDAGEQRAITLITDRTEAFVLLPGSGGPRCPKLLPPVPQPSDVSQGVLIPPRLTVSGFSAQVIRKTPLFFQVMLGFIATRAPLNTTVTPTHYRFGEISDLSGVAWTPYTGTIITELRYRPGLLTAYGPRSLYLQVKSDNLESNVEPFVLNAQPVRTIEIRLEGASLGYMLSYAEQRGFPIRTRDVSVTQSCCGGLTFQRQALRFQIVDGCVASGPWESVMEVNLLELSTKRFTPGWRVKGIEVGRSPDTSANQTLTGQSDGDGFRLTIRWRKDCGPGSGQGCRQACLANFSPLNAIVLEGPADDLAIDQANRWLNMFPG